MNDCNDKRWTDLVKIISQAKQKGGAVIVCLQGAQTIFGYLNEDILEFISKNLGVSVQKLYEVASYYPQFKLGKTALHKISVCMGTACYVRGGGEILSAIKQLLNISEGDCTSDGYFSLDTVRCLGCCALAPVMMIDNESFSSLKATDVNKIINNFKEMHPQNRGEK